MEVGGRFGWTSRPLRGGRTPSFTLVCGFQSRERRWSWLVFFFVSVCARRESDLQGRRVKTKKEESRVGEKRVDGKRWEIGRAHV